VEFENLVAGELNHSAEASLYGSAAVTDHERSLVSERKFHDLVQYQIQVDAEIDAKLQQQEEQLRAEEEKLIAAKRLAAARPKLSTDQQRTTDQHRDRHSWDPLDVVERVWGQMDYETAADRIGAEERLGADGAEDDNWVSAEITGSSGVAGADDFAEFLASVECRSVNTSTQSTVNTDQFTFHAAAEPVLSSSLSPVQAPVSHLPLAAAGVVSDKVPTGVDIKCNKTTINDCNNDDIKPDSLPHATATTTTTTTTTTAATTTTTTALSDNTDIGCVAESVNVDWEDLEFVSAS